MESSVEIQKILVKEGTLILTDRFSAPENLQITVESGARLLSTRSGLFENFEVNCPDGGNIGVYVEFTPDTNETVPVTITNANFEVLPGRPLSVMLSQSQLHPLHTTNRLEVLRFSLPTTLTAEDFVDVTDKKYGLPYTWFEIEEEQGPQVVYSVSRPVIYQETYSHNSYYRNQYVLSKGNEIKNEDQIVFGYMWTDHQVAHAGADYVVDYDYAKEHGTVVGSEFYVYSWHGWKGETIFPGESLTIKNGYLWERSRKDVYTHLRVFPGMGVTSAGYSWGIGMSHLCGTLEFMGSYENPVRLESSKDIQPHDFRLTALAIDGEMIGDGWVQFQGNGFADSGIFSTNTAYTGGFTLSPSRVDALTNQAVQIQHPYSLGGPLPEFNQKSFAVVKDYCGLCANTTMTLETPNRGIYFEKGTDFFRTPEGVQLTLREPLHAVEGFRKTGSGTLALGGDIFFGENGEA